MEMRILITLSVSMSSLIIPAILAAADQHTANPDEVCAEKKCSPNGPAVRFPFLLQGKQTENCGYGPAYYLYCDNFNRTIIELSSLSIKFLVVKINYTSSTIQVRSTEDCLAKHLRDLDMSTTPFQIIPYDVDWFVTQLRYRDMSDPCNLQFSLFNCSTSKDNLFNISCLDNHGYKVYAAYQDEEVWDTRLQFCTKMYDTKSLPIAAFEGTVNTPPEFCMYDPRPDSNALFGETRTVDLIWSLPLCKRCEMRGGICRGGNEANQIVCLGGKKHNSGVLKVLHIVGPIMGFMFLILVLSVIYLAYSTKKLDKENQMRIRKFLEDYTAMKPTRYSYADIRRMTNDFKDKLGEGSYGNVFKGKVSNEIFVAVKLLHNSTGNGEEFINEVGTVGRIHHVNVVRLLGFCAEGFKRALVFEFLPNGSLDKFIFPEGKELHRLRMEKLQDIAVGIARGVEYLHQGCEQRILHFDIKPHNVLLDENYNPKISDFGLAKLCEKGRSAVSMTAARGTMGYVAPEVFSRHFGNASYKSDIYSFGMLLLEMVGRRKNIDANVQKISQVYFPEWVYVRLVKGEELRIQFEEDGDDKIAKKLAIVGLWCIQWNPADRPSITSVLQMLEGSGENLSLPPDPFTSANAINAAADPSEHARSLGSPLAVISESE